MKKLKILLIEDERVIAKNLKDILETWNYDVIDINSTAEDAFESIYHYDVDLVISDIEIKGLTDGIEISKIFENIFNTPIIFITAYNDEDKKSRISNMKNVVGYLVKPIKMQDLKDLIEKATIEYDLSSDKKVILNDLYTYDFRSKTLYENNNEVELTRNEKLLLSILINAQNDLVAYDIINKAIWGTDDVSSGTRRQLIHRLKVKLSNMDILAQKGRGIYLKR